MAIIPDLIIVDMKASKGVLAGRHFQAGNTILELTGDVLSFDGLGSVPYCEWGLIQIGPGQALRIDKTCAARFMKHSCEPNAGLTYMSDGRVELKAIHHIPPMGEIVWDFSTTISLIDQGKEFDCECKKKSCRQKIGSYQNLPEPVRRRYEYLGIVAPYLAPQTVIR